MLGIVLNRLNVSIIGFQWTEPVRYVPTPYEVVVTLGVISAEIWVLRWVINRMPVLGESPAWVREEAGQPVAAEPVTAGAVTVR
jgi:Ni/Fe-hydrogenase subunit HybB-like protein